MVSSDLDNVAKLELLRAQRAQLANRLKTPWWYVAATVFAWAAAFAMPIGSHYFIGAGVWCALLAIVVFFLAQHALAMVSGVDVGIRTWQYPSGRAWTIAMIVVIVAATGVETLSLEHGLLAAAVVVGVLATLAGTGCSQGHLRGIRRDLETGGVAI